MGNIHGFSFYINLVSKKGWEKPSLVINILFVPHRMIVYGDIVFSHLFVKILAIN